MTAAYIGDLERECGFYVGQDVQKKSGYEYPGTVVSIFRTSIRAIRLVVEHQTSRGMLHIFSPDQLEPFLAKAGPPA